MFKSIRDSLLAIHIFLLLTLFIVGEAVAATYYCSPTGSGSTCSSGSPCSLSTGLGKLTAGDTLYLKNGTYTQSLTIPASGTSGNYITIKAENTNCGSACAVVDGEYARSPLLINSKSYINVEDIQFKRACPDAACHVVSVVSSSYINLKRITAYDASSSTTNSHIFLVYKSNNVLLEDCAAMGFGRIPYCIYFGNNVTLRRCFGRYTHSDATATGITFYHTNNSLMENNILFVGNPSNSADSGMVAFSNDHNYGDYNKFYGNIVIGKSGQYYSGYEVSSRQSGCYQRTNNKFYHNVSIDTPYRGFMNEADNNVTIENLTSVITYSNSGYGARFYEFTDPIYGCQAANNTVAGTLKNSSFVGYYYGLLVKDDPQHSIINTYNNYYGYTTQYSGKASSGTGEKTLNPSYNTSTYGKGAYLMVPSALKGQGENGSDIGANVLYRYQDVTLTNVPLWPWPMEERIYKETGISVTWETNGGIWKTLDGVYQTSHTTPAPGAPYLHP